MSAPPRVWGTVSLRAEEDLGEALLAGLGRLALGAEVVPQPTGGTPRLVIYVDTPATGAQVRAWISSELDRRGLDPERVELEASEVADRGWVELYQASLTPFDVGARFRVYPRGHLEGAPPRERIPLLIEPGRAFGTGEHPTTRLCVAALERAVQSGSRWIDLGCGTGILAMVARHSGARHVLALDLDPEAIEVARSVLALNRMDSIDLATGSLERDGLQVDGVVANILAPFFLTSAAALAARVRPEGTVVASGLLASEIENVRAALAAEGLVERSHATDGEWAAIVATSTSSRA